MTLEAASAVGAIGTQLDTVAAQRFAALEHRLARQGYSADGLAEFRARWLADWLVWKYEVLAQLEAWLRASTGSPA